MSTLLPSVFPIAMNHRAALLSAALIACCSFASTARADMSDAERRSSARTLFFDGVKLQDQGQAAQALQRFEGAQKLFEAPTHLLHIAECQALTGKLVEAAETYRTLVNTPLPDGAPEAFVQAKQQGAAELTPLLPRIPKLQINVTVAKTDPKAPASTPPQGLHVVVNGEEIPTELVGVSRPVNPGQYTVAASAEGYKEAHSAPVNLAERATQTVTLVLEPGASEAPLPAAVPASAPAPAEYKMSTPASSRNPSNTGFLLGGHVGLLAPSGKVDSTTAMSDTATTGGAFGLDAAFRFARGIYIGAQFDYGVLGSPNTPPPGSQATQAITASSHTFYAGPMLGFLSSYDKVGILGELGIGYRSLSRNWKIGGEEVDRGYTGSEFAFGGGLTIPAGKLRIVPKLMFNLGRFSERTVSCRGTTAFGGSACAGGGSIANDAQHGMVSLGITLFYSAELGAQTRR